VTVPEYFLFISAACLFVRGLFGVLAVIDDCKFGADRGKTPPGVLTCDTVGADHRPYDRETDVA
jgi:hypothetical protein